MKIINNPIIEVMKTAIRDTNTNTTDLQNTLQMLGRDIASSILGDLFVEPCTVITPLNETANGFHILSQKAIIISTRDEFNYFAQGLYDVLNRYFRHECQRGYIDFAGDRGTSTLSSSIRAIDLPNLSSVDTVIVAKSVLATGCTAITLLQNAIEHYHPTNIVVASVFYSNQGISELESTMPNCNIYVTGEPDSINANNLLVPGVGILEQRLS